MKKKTLKLQLSRQTIANLNREDMAEAKGGIVVTTTNPYTVTWLECCGPIWVTYPTMTFCGLECP